MPQAPKTLNSFEAIVQVIHDLRGPDGCPWDKEQTHSTLTQYAIEEVHEMVEAVESGDDAHICEELGDVLFQVVLHAEIAEQRKAFNIEDVIEGITSKIVRRHPHVFSDVKVTDSNEVIKNWEEIKRLEKKDKPASKDFFNVPPSLPSLQRSHKIGERTEKFAFDWNDPRQVLTQVKAEIAELEAAMEEKDQNHIEHELGDVLFSVAQLARHLNAEPESTLREANRRFIRRFEKMVEISKSLDEFVKLSAVEKEHLWTLAKRNTK